jgi:hypothetical protein
MLYPIASFTHQRRLGGMIMIGHAIIIVQNVANYVVAMLLSTQYEMSNEDIESEYDN